MWAIICKNLTHLKLYLFLRNLKCITVCVVFLIMHEILLLSNSILSFFLIDKFEL